MMPSDPDRDDIDALYRRLARLDRSEPAETTRAAILAHAEHRTAEPVVAGPAVARRQRRPVWLGPTFVGTLAAGILACLVWAPEWLPWQPAHLKQASVTPEPRRATNIAAEQLMKPAASGPAPSAPDVEPAAARATPPARPARPRLQPGEPAPPQLVERKELPAPAPAMGIAADSRRALSGLFAHVAPAPAVARAAGVGPSPAEQLRRVARAGDTAQLEQILRQNPDINAPDDHGRTALLLATQQQHDDIVAVLLEHGANPNLADADDLTPLQVARAANATDLVSLLMRYGAR
jgi:hypothetical protein